MRLFNLLALAGASPELPELENEASMSWYKNLSTNQKINLKDCFKLLCGVEFDSVGRILSFRQRICLVHSKLKMEGFEV